MLCEQQTPAVMQAASSCLNPYSNGICSVSMDQFEDILQNGKS